MRWTPGGTSSDIEDRRGEGGGPSFGGFGGRHLGIGGTLVLLVLSLVFRQNFFALFSPSGSSSPQVADRPVDTAGERKEVEFISFVLDDAQQTWEKLLPPLGANYRHAKLVLFRDQTESSCGQAESATGPFYCPGDEKVYVDLGFFDELSTKFGAPGEFAQAYVLAHELGHHVQKLTGIERKVRAMQESDPRARNQLSVRLELQADCLAGVWAHSPAHPNLIEKSDVDAGLRAAAAVGDDRLQRMSTGRVSPESFTHGSSAQRSSWFRRGLDSGEFGACNTLQ